MTNIFPHVQQNKNISQFLERRRGKGAWDINTYPSS
jgi:hypothetical protein